MAASAGAGADSVNQSRFLTEACAAFNAEFSDNKQGVLHIGVAPGRVNLIGEHTDYNDGFVMPFALEQRTCCVGRANGRDVFRFYSLRFGTASREEFNEQDVCDPKKKSWSSYVRGVIAQFSSAGHKIAPFDALIHSAVPLGGGLSSSAALEVCVATFLESYLNTKIPPATKAQMCQKAEHEFAGVPCGIMDQFVSVHAKQDHCILLDCRALEYMHVPFDRPEAALVIINSNVKHDLATGEYAKRRAECEEVVQVLRSVNSTIKNLRDATPFDLQHAWHLLNKVQLKRARHVVRENHRVLKCADALRNGDLRAVGKLMNASHKSLSKDYEVSCKELDLLVHLAQKCPYVYGSRMTGGGFGGCTITLMDAKHAKESIARILREYKKKTGIEATVLVSKMGGGCEILTIQAKL